MARPVHADPVATKRRLLRAARSAFASQGYDATSLRQIAADAGLTLGTIFHYFGSKSGLYEACVSGARDALDADIAPVGVLLAELAASVQDQDALPLVLERSVRQGFRAARVHQEALRLILRPLVDQGALAPDWANHGLVPFLVETTDALACRLELEPGDLRLRLQSVVALGVRYALASAAELARLAAIPEADAVAHFETHLVTVALQLLLPRAR